MRVEYLAAKMAALLADLKVLPSAETKAGLRVEKKADYLESQSVVQMVVHLAVM